jgi:hypothetical protein
MRLAILALFLSAGTTAFCQSAVPPPTNLNPQGLTAPQYAQPREWHFNTDSPQRTIILQAPVPEQPRNATQIDPKIIVHPPQSSIGEQAPATQIAQNLYPGLTLLPISEWKGNGQQIPITWPNLNVRNIPTTWPKLEIKSVESGPTAISAGK